MKKNEFNILERAFESEVNYSLHKIPSHLMQTKSKIADKLVEDGFLRKCSVRLNGPFPCTVDGYELTHSGRIAYCSEC